MFKNFWGSHEQQADPRPQEMPTGSWYPPSVISSPSSSRPTTPGASTSSSFGVSRHTDRANHLANVSPAEAAGIIAILREKSVDELRKLLSDKDAYQSLLLSLEPVKTQNMVRDELRNETLHLARDNLEKEPRMMELRNQCMIIRTTELATAQEKLHELERKKEETLHYYSPSSLLHQLHGFRALRKTPPISDAMTKLDEESEALSAQLLDREIDLSTFIQKYKKIRYTYHKRALTHLAAKTSITN